MFKQVGDLNVHYDVQGEGYPLVLLHGGGSRSQCYEEMTPILSKHFRVYTYDHRGFGETERPPEPNLSHDLWREDLGAILDAFGLDKVALGGWSLGGGIALDFTLKYPGRVTQFGVHGSEQPASGAHRSFGVRSKAGADRTGSETGRDRRRDVRVHEEGLQPA